MIQSTNHRIPTLPAHLKERLLEILESFPATQKRCSIKRWQKVLGELRSMSIPIPGSRGLFSLLQEALRHREPGSRLHLSRGVHDCLEDFRWICADLSARPTRLYEIVPQPQPELLGTEDACGYGMGGVWFPASPHLQSPRSTAVDTDEKSGDVATTPPLLSNSPSLGPILWRAPFPKDVVQDLVSHSNPSGQITNSDLELAATIIQHDVAAHQFDIRERTIASGSDNTPAVAWQRKGSTTTTSAPAYLLRLQALHQRFHRYSHYVFYIPGPINVMADDCSRLFNLSDAELLTLFNTLYPQKISWRLVQPRKEMLASVISALRRQRVDPASFLHEPLPMIKRGKYGQLSVPISMSTPGSQTSKTQS
jgi:hypothetical protein